MNHAPLPPVLLVVAMVLAVMVIRVVVGIMAVKSE
jgi:hypothetical protein